MTAIATETRRKTGPAPTYGEREFFALRLEPDDAAHVTRAAAQEGSAQAYLLRLVQQDRALQQEQQHR